MANITELKASAIFLCLLSAISLEAQIRDISFTVGGNVTAIKTVQQITRATTLVPSQPTSAPFSSTNPDIFINEVYEPKLGVALGVEVRYKILSKLFLTSGIRCNFQRFDRSIIFEGGPDNAFNFEFSALNSGETALLATDVPLLAAVPILINKLTLRSGIVFSYLLNANYSSYEYQQFNFIFTKGGLSPSPNEPNLTDRPNLYDSETRYLQRKTYNNTEGYRTFTTGIVIEVSYKVMKSTSVEVGFQKNFTPIYEQARQYAGDAKITAFYLNLRYSIPRRPIER